MTRRFTTLLQFLTSLVCGLKATAQPVRPQPAEPGTGVSLSLGHSMLLLYGPWKFRVSDSPIDAATNQPLWAQPEFDDAAWSCLQWRLF
jgi:hypothetical protein